MPRCGNCKGHHETFAGVRACYGMHATQKQLDFLKGLRAERGLEEAQPSADWTKKAASEEIHRLLKTPKSVAPAQVKASTERSGDIPEGYYATKSASGHNDLDFWKVDKPTEGRWKGYTFVKRVIGGRASVNVRKHEKTEVLRAIREAGPEQAMQLFGQTLGKCGKCGRHLTDEQSRALGIGPVCRSRS